MYNQLIEKLETIENRWTRQERLIVVVGEFNHGKSTFINALLQSKFLPMGIRPTTATINIIKPGPLQIEVVDQRDNITSLPADETTLQAFIGDAEVEWIKEIRVTVPDFPLDPTYRIVDTPGLNDLNQARSAVAYRYIPEADIVFFLLKADQPLSKSEREFLEETLLKNGLDKIVFVLNFVSLLEEDEEEEVIEELEYTLSSIEGITEPDIMLIDAKDILETGEGIEALQSKILAYTQKAEKNGRFNTFNTQLELIEAMIEEEKAMETALLNVREDERAVLEMRLVDSLNNKDKLTNEVNLHLSARQQEILQLSERSLSYFVSELREKITEEIDHFHTTAKLFPNQLKHRVERIVQMETKRWVEENSKNIILLLNKVFADAVKSLETFGVRERKWIWQSNAHKHSFGENVKGEDARLKAGLVTGGAAVILGIVGTGGLLPAVGLIAYPFLQAKLEDNALAEYRLMAKGKLEPLMREINLALKESISLYIHQKFEEMHKDITEHLESFYRHSSISYMDMLKNIETDRESWILNQEQERTRLQSKLSELRKSIKGFQHEGV